MSESPSYKIFTIAGGNLTALVMGPGVTKASFLRRLTAQVEQVGIVDTAKMSLDMLGGEMCINASLATAKMFGGSGDIRLLGGRLHGEYINDTEADRTTVTILPSVVRPAEDVVLFDAIGFQIGGRRPSAAQIRALALKYGLPAFGHVEITPKGIIPSVFVGATGAYLYETACGTGSLAAAIVANLAVVVQPTGEAIEIAQVTEGRYSLTARVTEQQEVRSLSAVA